MGPVVDRLEDEYSDAVEIRRIDANSITGKSTFQEFQLFGHPGFVVLAPDGAQLWISQGEQTYEVLSEQIRQLVSP